MAQHENTTKTCHHRLEMSISDAMIAPGTTKGQRVNFSLVWLRLDGGPWRATGFRSLEKARRIADTFADPAEAFAEMTEDGE